MYYKEYLNPKDCFNALSPIPEKQIDLGDGRTLITTLWEPCCTDEVNQTPIKIEGIIVRNLDKN